MATDRTLGERIRDARVDKDLGLREFARKVEVTPSYLSDIENDRRVPSEEVMLRICESLELNFDEMMSLGGKIGEDAAKYIKKTPAAGMLFRKLSQGNVSEKEVEALLKTFEKKPGGGKSK